MSRNTSGRALVASIAILAFGPGQTMSAQPSVQAPASREARTALWTAAGAGAGFGIGIWAGLHAFDDAVNSDRKVWTTAILSAAAGGAIAYLLTRDHGKASVQRSRRVRPLDVRSLGTRSAPTLGTGTFRAWLEQELSRRDRSRMAPHPIPARDRFSPDREGR